MALSNKRVGRITSSEIVSLTGIGNRQMTEEELKLHKEKNPKSTAKLIAHRDTPTKPFFTYVDECIMERFFKRELENKKEVLAFSWGKLVEVFVHNILPNNYIFHSEDTQVHPLLPEWVGTPDGSKRIKFRHFFKTQTITDIKCPLTLKSFYNLVKHLYDFDGFKAKKKKNVNGWEVMQKIREEHQDGDKFYWQLVSNACITGATYAELIVFVPYKDQLQEIIDYNRSLDEPFWLVERCNEGELPFIHKLSGVKNINIIRFKVPQEDKYFLTERVEKAIELINA